MSRTILALVAKGRAGGAISASAASDRACLGQTLKTEVGTAGFGRSIAQEAQEARPFGTNVASPLAPCP
jgi:hypothetical protein